MVSAEVFTCRRDDNGSWLYNTNLYDIVSETASGLLSFKADGASVALCSFQTDIAADRTARAKRLSKQIIGE